MSYQIVVGVDGSENSERALEFALEEAALRDAELTALFAWQLPLIGIPRAFDRDELEAEAKEFLINAVAASQAPPELKINQVVAQGDPSTSLLTACDRVGADLLVIGARGREGGMLLGSVVDCALRSPCPVVIVKPEPAAA